MFHLDISDAKPTQAAEEQPTIGEVSVQVFVRIRPLNTRELEAEETVEWEFDESSLFETTLNGGRRSYVYDRCFGPDSTNLETYEIIGKPVVLKAMDGYNGTVFTYGQTGSGKTWTMRGNDADPGMMVLCLRDIFDYIANNHTMRYTLRVSYLEVYNEEINDLLGDGRNLKILHEDATRGAFIGGLSEELCKSTADFMTLLRRGEAARSYASTKMNSDSSRSHTIYRVTIEANIRDGKDDECDASVGRYDHDDDASSVGTGGFLTPRSSSAGTS
jgi:centromeric protein E